ncbi:DUF6249 domain-containing protein [Microbacter margulisiae]|uniref:Putative PurR-regulated permease PerM n=1 Tax=Microbacter margulisiae TaxID=1350067 RepID=A0A7W5DQY0_9PORP|nr:DUF6249 domain-containing protein [Microbacter margulisiae]MBB3187391.1 putative PurR-regulated permease PerM [Microbacter margulisiae]
MKKIGFLLLFVLCGVFATTKADIKTDKLLATTTQHVAPTANKDSVSSTADSSYGTNKDQQESELIQKLSPDQLLELEKIRSGENEANPLGAVGIVLISMMPFVTAILIVFFVMYSKRKKEQRLMDLYEKAIESGRDLPADFFKRPEEDQKSYLLKGLVWLAVGIGLSIGMLYLMGFNSPWAFGMIPGLVGIAYGISYFVEKKNKANNTNNE